MLRTFTVAIVCGLILAMLIAWQSSWPNAHADTSGTNSSGYTWVDSNSPDPATTFEWIDATGGTRLAISDEDDEWETVNLPFPFTFFDNDFSQVAVASNGFLSFDTTDTAGCNLNYNGTFTDELGSPIPHDDANCTDDGWGSNPLIAVWFDDLSPLNCGDIYHDSSGTAPDRKFVVEFNNICHYDCASTCDALEAATFEVIFFEGSNTLKLQYLDTYYGENTPNIAEENYGGTATTGINLDGNTGLQYSWADPILTDGLAVFFSTSCPADEDCDGVLDGDDLCPDTPPEEAVDANGCSDSQLDDDEDGVSNADDLCPLDAEDVDGFQDSDGCPDPDNDQDGFPDSTDDCPGTDYTAGPDGVADTGDEPLNELGVLIQTKEDYDGVLDGDGCHDSPGDDFDGDGFTDELEALSLGTAPGRACALTPTANDEDPDSLPTDFDDDQDTDVIDVLYFKPHISKSDPDPDYSARFDFDVDADVDIIDVLFLQSRINTSCVV